MYIRTRVLLTVILLVLCQCILVAQSKPVTLSGTINVNTGESFPYEIVVTETAGIIKGYSLTYEEPHDTKAVIEGTIDRRTHRLTFKEKDILYSHGFHTKAYMCLINATLEYVQSGKGYALKGPITSTEADNTVCTGGTITFDNAGEIDNLFGYHDQFDTVISMGKKPKVDRNMANDLPVIKEEPGNEKDVVKQAVDKITTGVEKAYDWYSDSVVIDVWDGGNVDGDRISVLFNNVPYLTNYYLVKEKRQLRIALDPIAINTITIVANTEGSDPPNTASISLTDGKRKYNVLAYNLKGERSVIKLRKVK